MTEEISFLDTKIFFQAKGNGPAVILLHGFPESSAIWNDFAEELSKDFFVVTPDFPGHGKSGLPSSVTGLETYADSVHTVVNHLQINSFTLVGHSMGGYVVMAYAKKYQSENLLNGIGLFHSTVFADSEEKKVNRNRAIEVVKNDRLTFIAELIPSLFAKENVSRYSEEIIRLKEIAKICSSESIVASLASMRDREDTSEFMSASNLPFLFILGKKDNSIPFAQNFPIVDFPKKSFSVILDDVGHMGFIEAKQETLFALRNFLKFCSGKN